MRKLREMQVNFLNALSTSKAQSAAEIADAVDSYPGPATRGLLALTAKGLVAKFGTEAQPKFKRTAAGSKALAAGGIE